MEHIALFHDIYISEIFIWLLVRSSFSVCPRFMDAFRSICVLEFVNGRSCTVIHAVVESSLSNSRGLSGWFNDIKETCKADERG